MAPLDLLAANTLVLATIGFLEFVATVALALFPASKDMVPVGGFQSTVIAVETESLSEGQVELYGFQVVVGFLVSKPVPELVKCGLCVVDLEQYTCSSTGCLGCHSSPHDLLSVCFGEYVSVDSV